MKKGLFIGVGVLVVVIAVAAYVLFAGLDDLVKTAVEKGGSAATKVDVTLDKAQVKLSDGSATLTGLKVGNPPGFKSGSAFELGSVSVKIDTSTVTSDPVVIKEVVVQSPKVTYEMGPNGSNIDVIKKNVEQMAGGGGSSQSSGEGKKVVIENLYVRGGSVGISATALGGKTMTAALPEIHLKDIGKDKGGADASTVAAEVMAALTSRVNGFVSGLDLSGVLKGGEGPASLIAGAHRRRRRCREGGHRRG